MKRAAGRARNVWHTERCAAQRAVPEKREKAECDNAFFEKSRNPYGGKCCKSIVYNKIA